MKSRERLFLIVVFIFFIITKLETAFACRIECCSAGEYEYDPDGTGDMCYCQSCPSNYTSNYCSWSSSQCYHVVSPPSQQPPLPPDCGPGYTGPAGHCTPCITSTYKPSTGSDACTACPLNSHHELQAQASVSACVCDPGYMIFDLGKCTPVEKKDTMSVYTSNIISGSSNYYADKKNTFVWKLLILLTSLLLI
jgi:hypothetical protein